MENGRQVTEQDTDIPSISSWDLPQSAPLENQAGKAIDGEPVDAAKIPGWI